MNKRPPAYLWIELALATVSGALGLLTLVWRDWLEGVFGWDPDHHSGSLESLLVAALLLVALASGALARRGWRRHWTAAAGQPES
jgi:DMSO/TMAO reductase YedYZ heme-binding membrane subunit